MAKKVKVPEFLWAFDPGLHCGWAVWSAEFGLLGSGEPRLLGPSDCSLMLDEMYEAGGVDGFGWPEVVIYEDFTLRPQPSGVWGQRVGLSPVYVAAWIQGILVAGGYSGEWVAQMLGQRKVVDNVYLREIGWWVKNSLGHDHDAMRHLLVYLRKQGISVDGSRL